MIFDNIEDFDQIEQSLSSLHKPVFKTSLHSFFEDKKNEIENGNFLNLYDVYQIKQNENFINNLKHPKQCQKINKSRKQSIELTLEKRMMNQHCYQNSLNYIDMKEKTKELLLADSRTNFDSDELSIDEFDGEMPEEQPKNSFYCKNQISIQENLEIDNVADFDKKKLNKVKSLNYNFKVRKMDERKLKSFNFVSHHVANVGDDMLNSFVSLDGMVKEQERIKAEEEICMICYKGYDLNDFIVKLRKCDHIFHKECIDDWVKLQNWEKLTCLVCHEDLN